MQELYKTYDNDTLAMACEPGEEDEEASVLILELVVPVTAVPVLHQPVSTAVAPLQHSLATSTAPGQIITQLRVTNTALATAWCTTATLMAANPTRRARL